MFENILSFFLETCMVRSESDIIRLYITFTLFHKLVFICDFIWYRFYNTTNWIIAENLNETVDKTLINEFGTDDATQLHEQQDTPTTEEGIRIKIKNIPVWNNLAFN